MSAQFEEESTSTAALRAELEEELKRKKQCTYQPYECTQLCLGGYKFCSKHILQDKNAPFKQCSYVLSTNGKRCHLPAPRCDKKDYGYCHEHALRATLARNKQNSKHQPPKTAEVLLNSLSHYIRKPKSQTASSSYSDENRLSSDDNTEQKTTKYNDPFVDLDASSIYNNYCNEVLDYCSESESDVEPSTLSSVWHDAHADSSDDESIDSEQEDPLKHANIYTAEEVTLIMRDKLIRLQSLYVEQYRHLQYLLKEKRRKYLHALKREKETCCNIYSQVRDNPKEQRLYKKLKALNNYQKCNGIDAILNKRLKDLRSKTNDASASKTHSSVKCTFTEGGVKCGERTLPLTKFCKKHILEDPNQILFRACGKVNADVECTTPIVALFEDSACQLHMEIPPLKSYNHVRKDSESDLDDTGEATNTTNYPTDNFSENIKHEFVPYEIPPELPKMETLPSLLFEENSQSISESTISQNEIFSMNDPNFNNSYLKEEDENKSNVGFYQISESCTLVPSTSGLISINTSSKDHQQLQSLKKSNLESLKESNIKLKEVSPGTSALSKLQTKSSSLTEQLMHSASTPGPSRLPDSENLSTLSESQETDEVLDMETETISMEEVNNEIEVVEEPKEPEVMEEQSMPQCEMEVCTEEVLHMTDDQLFETKCQQSSDTKDSMKDV